MHVLLSRHVGKQLAALPATRRAIVGHTDDCGQSATRRVGFAATGARLHRRTVTQSAVFGNGVLARSLALHLLCCEAMQPDAWRLFWQASVHFRQRAVIVLTDLWFARGHTMHIPLVRRLDSLVCGGRSEGTAVVDRLSVGRAGPQTGSRWQGYKRWASRYSHTEGAPAARDGLSRYHGPQAPSSGNLHARALRGGR